MKDTQNEDSEQLSTMQTNSLPAIWTVNPASVAIVPPETLRAMEHAQRDTQAFVRGLGEVVQQAHEGLRPMVVQISPIAESFNAVAERLKPVIRSINATVEPLTPLIRSINATVEPLTPLIRGINATVEPLTPLIRSINATVEPLTPLIRSINATVEPLTPLIRSINATVEPLTPLIRSINATVEPLTPLIRGINATVEPLTPLIRSINRSINATVEPLTPLIRSINRSINATVEPLASLAARLREALSATLLRWSQACKEAGAPAQRLAPLLHEWRQHLQRIQERRPYLNCELTMMSLRERDISVVKQFAADTLRIKVAHDELYFVALALTVEPWATKRDPIAYLRKVVSIYLRQARHRPESDPRSAQFLPRAPRLGPDATAPLFVSLDQEPSEEEDHCLADILEDVGARQPLHETLFRYQLAKTNLRPEAQQLLLLRQENVGKKQAATMLGWTMAEVERYWKEIDRAEAHLRLRFLS
ncbi:hypothetical protein ACN6A1_06100 [Myxococcus virescens]|uniref:hypothetical protein n=1 Tax=Myxococcus virescens TaxID=83456 RepID=UPI003DA3C488